MIVLCIFLLVVTTAIHAVAFRSGVRAEGLHSPLAVVAGLNWIRIVPYAFFVGLDQSVLDQRVASFVGANSLIPTLANYLFLETIGSAIVLLFVWKAKLRWQRAPIELALPIRFGLLLLVVGVFLVAYKVFLVGGTKFLLENIDRRSDLTAGFGFLVIPTYLFIAAAVVVFASALGKGARTGSAVAFVVVVVIGMVIFAMFGGRKNGLLLLLTGLLSWSVYVRPVRLASSFSVIAIGLAFVYMNGVWLLRQTGGIEAAVSEPSVMLASIGDMWLKVFADLSYLPTYLSTISHFERSDYWFGAIFTAAPEALIPSLIYPDKPPLDEGVYFRSFAAGYYVYPPMPAGELYHSSAPPETFGNGYAAMGAFGVVTFYLFKAFLVVYGWRLGRRIVGPFTVVFLVYLLYGAEVSPYRLVQLAQVFVMCWILGSAARRMAKSARQRR